MRLASSLINCTTRRLYSSSAAAAKGPALEVFASPLTGGGRGLFAARDVDMGETVLASPLNGAFAVVHPMLASAQGVCWRCLKWLSSSQRQHHGEARFPKRGEEAFCSERCEQAHAISDAADLGERRDGATNELRELCEGGGGATFPLLAHRLARAVVAGESPVSLLQPLVHARLDTVPDAWAEAHRVYVDALPPHANGALDTLEWFVGVLQRAHLNAFRVSTIRHDTSRDGLLAALSADISSSATNSHSLDNGVAVYLHASLLNHSCEPNVAATWPSGDANVSFVALRALERGEEATVTYTDNSASLRVRRGYLNSAYGFQCHCIKCTADEEEEEEK